MKDQPMKIYTRTGDLGETALLGGPRVGKDMVRIEACGAVDELNSALGLARAEPLSDQLDDILRRIQNELFEMGAELASPDPVRQGTRTIGPPHIQQLECDIDRLLAPLEQLQHFILPGGARAGAALHLARAICRRVERRVVLLIRHSEEEISLVLLAYINRLSDLLFVAARTANAEAKRPDTLWERSPA